MVCRKYSDNCKEKHIKEKKVKWSIEKGNGLTFDVETPQQQQPQACEQNTPDDRHSHSLH